MKKLSFFFALSFLAGVLFTSCKSNEPEPEPNGYDLNWQCTICGWIYEFEKGYPEEGIVPGTFWEEVPNDFCCPICGVSKDMFEPYN